MATENCPPRNSNNSRGRTPMLCRFFAQGHCRAGPSCSFSHDLASVALCKHHIAGSCKFGTRCGYVHGELCTSCSRHVLHPFNIAQAEEHQAQCAQRAADEQPACAICYEGTVSQFGLLPACDHAFCLDCIRSWRSSKGVAKDTVRSCPLCREQSDFVVPSDFFATGDSKERVITAYRERLAQLPCKYYEQKGDCPFREKCFYLHKGPLPPRRRRPRLTTIPCEVIDMYTSIMLDGAEFDDVISHLILAELGFFNDDSSDDLSDDDAFTDDDYYGYSDED